MCSGGKGEARLMIRAEGERETKEMSERRRENFREDNYDDEHNKKRFKRELC